MGEVVDLAARRRPPSWLAWVMLAPGEPGWAPEARLVEFAGEDGIEPPSRLTSWAAALRRLADEMDATASDLGQ